MKKNFTKIAVVLDRSGSMANVRKATVDNFNEFIGRQKREPGTASLSLFQFDDVYENVLNAPLNMVKTLTESDFVPRGWTALYDAIGKTIDDLGAELAGMKESDRPSKVIVVIMTDGGENASKTYRQQQVAEKVKHQREKYKWEFIFLGANQDAVLTAQGFNIPVGSSMTYASNPVGMTNTVNSLCAYVSTVRSGGLAKFDDQDRNKAMATQ